MIGSNRIGGLNSGQWQDPRSRGRFRVTGGTGLGMPNGLEAVRIYPGLQVPIGDLPAFSAAAAPPSGQPRYSTTLGQWYDPEAVVINPDQAPKIQAIRRGNPGGMANPVYRPGENTPAEPKRSTALMDLITGRADSITLRDPNLRGGSFNNWDRESPAIAAILDPAAAGFPDATAAGAAYGIPSAAVERLVAAGGPRRALLAPGSVTRSLTADDIPSQGVASLRDILDDTPRTDLTWQPGVGLTAGMGPRGDSAVERFPIDWGTGLPSDTRVGLRGRGGALAAETIALGGDGLGFASQDPGRVRTTQRGAADINEFGLVPVSWRNSDGSVTVREIDPTRGVFTYELDPAKAGRPSDNTAPFLRTKEVTLGTMVQDAMEDAKTPVMTQEALDAAERNGRFTPLPDDQRKGTLVGYITKTGAASPLPVYAPKKDGRPMMTMIEVPDGPDGAKQVSTRLYRVGSPLNRDPEKVRAALRDTLLYDVSTPDPTRIVNQHLIADTAAKGFSLVPAPFGELGRSGQAIGPALSVEAAQNWMRSLAGQPQAASDGTRNPMGGALQVVNRNGNVVETLVPETDLGGRFTGRLLPMQAGVGPTVLLDNPGIRRKGEWALQNFGLDDSEAGHEGTLKRLGAGAFMAEPDVVGLGEAGYLPLLVNSVLSPEAAAQAPGLAERLALFRRHQEQRKLPAQLPGVPRADGTVEVDLDPRLFPPGSHARTILRQNVHDYTNGVVDLRFADDRPAYVAPPATGMSPWEGFWGSVTPRSPEQRRAMYGLERQQPVRLSYDFEQAGTGAPSAAPTVVRDYDPSAWPGFSPLAPQATSAMAPAAPTSTPLPLFPEGAPASPLTPWELGRRLKAIEMEDEGAALWARGLAPRLRPTSDYLSAADPLAAMGANVPQSPGQLPIQFRDIDPEAVRVSRAAGAFDGTPYFDLDTLNAYQQPLSAAGAAGGFDYGLMARNLSAPIGSPEHERAMLQITRRIQQRQLERAAAQAGP